MPARLQVSAYNAERFEVWPAAQKVDNACGMRRSDAALVFRSLTGITKMNHLRQSGPGPECPDDGGSTGTDPVVGAQNHSGGVPVLSQHVKKVKRYGPRSAGNANRASDTSF